MGQKSIQENYSRFPAPFDDVDVNCCKYPSCENFGISAGANTAELSENANILTNNRHNKKRDPHYAVVGSGKSDATLKCKACELRNNDQFQLGNTYYPIKSNKAVVDELHRISAYLYVKPLQCPNHECPTYIKNETPKLNKRGLTACGNQRFVCGHCGTSFTMSDGRRKQSTSAVNKRVFQLLVNKSPLSRIVEIYGITFQTLYDKIHFFREQCLNFVAERERRLEKMQIDRLYLATDRQVQISNWTRKENKKNTELYGIGTACLNSSYVFAFNFNFDATMDPEATEKAAVECGDYDKPKYQREFARVWLKQEFIEASKRNPRTTPESQAMSIEEEVEQKIKSEQEYNQDLSSERIDSLTNMPSKGMLVHNEYTQAAHFFLLKRLFKNVGKTRFYLDLDSGMKNAYITAFKEEIQSDDSDGFLVNTTKNLTVNEKRKYCRDSIKAINALKNVDFAAKDKPAKDQIVADLIEEQLDHLKIIKASPERWLKYPLSTMSDPEKMIAAVTPMNKYDRRHQSNLYRLGSLHAIDRFFMQIRRSVSIFERSMSSGSNKGRNWFGYSAYNPEMYNVLADIYRVYYNYVKKGNDGKTPAMRLGLAEGPVSLEKIIYFNKEST